MSRRCAPRDAGIRHAGVVKLMQGLGIDREAATRAVDQSQTASS